MCVLYYHPDYGLWMGASPELLVSEHNGIFKTVALAGTKPDTGESTSQIAWSQKEIEEQAMVSRYIIDQFKKSGYANSRSLDLRPSERET